MIPGHRTTGTDQSGRVSGLMNLENRRSCRDLPAGTMTVPDLVDMFRADTGSGMRIQFRRRSILEMHLHKLTGRRAGTFRLGMKPWSIRLNWLSGLGEAIRILRTLILTGIVQAGMA